MNDKRSIPVAQYDGKTLVAKYRNITLAAEMSGAQPAHIGKVTNGVRNTAGGFHWKTLTSFDGKLSNKRTGIVQKDTGGNVLAVYSDLDAAAYMTGISKDKIEAVMEGTKRSVSGYIFAS
ncbi:MAG: hypothetical protein OEZ38_11445 [Gammaproteobacteria bacterium]|nr:hypothetical protein [Gammaproteobacteria bacterium]